MMDKYDTIGEYSYTPGYCIRDAFRRWYGDGPELDWFPVDCTWRQVTEFAAAHGLDYCINGRFDRSFAVGQPVVWLYEQPGALYGHATFSRDPQRLADVQESGQIRLIGYVVLD